MFYKPIVETVLTRNRKEVTHVGRRKNVSENITVTPNGYIHRGAFSRYTKDGADAPQPVNRLLRNNICPRCKERERSKTESGITRSYCKPCASAAAAEYVKKHGKPDLSNHKNPICPTCKLRNRITGRKDNRQCAECKRAASRRWYAKKRAEEIEKAKQNEA